MNINTKRYWDARFGTNNWENAGGREQTRQFAEAQIARFRVPKDFSGTILDFGCGLGDAIQVYARHYARATFIGVDISSEAIAKCCVSFGSLATFIQGDHTKVPESDIIIASNVMEHLTDDIEIARALLSRCSALYVIVPYKEELGNFEEHVNSYTRSYYRVLGNYTTRVFACPGWSEYGWRKRWRNIHLKNIKRLVQGATLRKRKMQIMFHFSRIRTDLHRGQ